MCEYRVTLHTSHRPSLDRVRTCRITASNDQVAQDSALHMANMFAAVEYEINHERCGR